MFYFSSDESEEEQPRSANSSDSVGSRIDDFEDTLERKLRMKSGSCYVLNTNCYLKVGERKTST